MVCGHPIYPNQYIQRLIHHRPHEADSGVSLRDSFQSSVWEYLGLRLQTCTSLQKERKTQPVVQI